MHAHNGIALAIELEHAFNYAYALIFASSVRLLRREEQEVYNHTESAITLSTEQGFSQWLANSTIQRGWALTARGQQEEGLTQLRQGLTDFRATGADLAVPYFLTLLAEGYSNLKQVKEGLGALREAVEVMERTGERYSEAEIYRLKGQLLLQQSSDNQAEAESCFQKAIAIAQNQQAKSWELRAATSLARLWQSQGKCQDAYDLLAPVYDWFTEGFDTADLIDAKALLVELEEGG
jgi:adenylate cyclase